MSVNSSSTFSDLLFYQCQKSKFKSYVIIGFVAVKTLFILPLCTFILYLAHQQWRQQRSLKAASHSDIFSYHLAAMELFWVIGSALFHYGDKAKTFVFLQIGISLAVVALYGEMCFHILTCVERYLAVVHPVTYLGLRNARGVRIRNITIGCVWLLCFVMMVIYGNTHFFYASITLLCLMPFSVIIITFCSISVLCALIRPGPGEGGREKERVDQVKLRAFHTITATSCVLWLWFLGTLVATALEHSPQVDDSITCVVTAIVNLFNLPYSLVSPLLYLHRAGKLPCCCFHTK